MNAFFMKLLEMIPLLAMNSMKQPEHSIGALGQAMMTRYVTARRLEEISVPDVEAFVLKELRHSDLKGIAYDFFSVIDFAAVRTFRLLQESWKPATQMTDFDQMRDTAVPEPR